MKEVNFIGHLITSKGLNPDPEKVRAIRDMPKPANVSGVRRIIGFSISVLALLLLIS
jgi:hypothetical protein